MENSKTKTGATPLPEVPEAGGGEIIGLKPVVWRGMAHFRDGYGGVSTKMINVFDNGDVYFEEGGKFVLSQKWFKAAVARKLAALASETEAPADLGTIEQG